MDTSSPSGAAAGRGAAGTDLKAVRSFAEFYPLYLAEHRDRSCRRMHFLGSSLALLCLVLAVVSRQPLYLLGALLAGYGCAWIGHFVFEKNRPASFQRPLYSFIGDWAMYRDIWLRRIPF